MKNSIQFAYSVQGYNHIQSNKVCQDSSGEYHDEQMSIIVLADGHGGNDYPRTDKGSKYAVECAIRSIMIFVCSIEDLNEYNYIQKLNDLSRNILMEWHECVNNDLLENPISDLELKDVSELYRSRYIQNPNQFCSNAYGTTLIAVCVTQNYWFGMQIGDGRCVTFAANGKDEPIPWDPKCKGNITTSLCDDNAIDEFRFCFGNTKNIPAAIFIGSDGVEDSYPEPAMEKVYQLYASVLQICMEHGEEKMKTEFEPYLSTITRKGSGDDISVCAWIDREKINVSIMKYLSDLYLAKIVEKNKEQKNHSFHIEMASRKFNEYNEICKNIKKITNNLNNQKEKLKTMGVSNDNYESRDRKVKKLTEELNTYEERKKSMEEDYIKAKKILEKKKELSSEIKNLVGKYNTFQKKTYVILPEKHYGAGLK